MYSLLFSSTWWVKSKSIADFAIQIYINWLSFGKIYNPKSIRNCEVLQIYKGLLNTNLFFFKSEVYSFINSLLLPYLLGYQIDKPLILLLLRNILNLFAKLKVIERCATETLAKEMISNLDSQLKHEFLIKEERIQLLMLR